MAKLFLDLSTTSRTSLKTGIERVAQTIFQECALLQMPTDQVVPVYLDYVDGQWQYRHASLYAAQVLGVPALDPSEPTVQMHAGDVLLVLDFSGELLVQAADAGLYSRLQAHGVATHALVYDLLPMTFPGYFPPGATKPFAAWLERIISLGSVIAISQSVATQLHDYLEHAPYAQRNKAVQCKIQWFHLGANFEGHVSDQALPAYAPKLIDKIARRPSFLCVGTIEPRKGYAQLIEAFTLLWDQGFEPNLVIVGAEGWARLPSAQRRHIPELVCRMRAHPQLGKRLFWFDGVNDAFLQQIYRSSACLLAPSEGEGFGLPLIEAAHYGLPILARDIAVFKEVMGEHAQYFVANSAPELAVAISGWYGQYCQHLHTPSEGYHVNTWGQ